MGPRNRDRRLVFAVAVSFALTILSFVVSRTITELQTRRIQREANAISQNALVAAEALITVRNDLRELASEMNTLRASAQPDVSRQLRKEIEAARDDVARSWAKYVSVPFYPGEREIAAGVAAELEPLALALDEVVERTRQGDRRGALRAIEDRALPAIARSSGGTDHLLELNRSEAEAGATRIAASARSRGIVPELVGAFFAVLAAYFGVRVIVRYLAWAAQRSAELERFAGRVAHDIRSPLGAASLALDVARRHEGVDTKTRELLERVTRTMQRVGQLVDGLLVFATSGGYIVPGEAGESHANVREVLDGVIEDLTQEAHAKQIALEYEPPDGSLVVACSPGVLISMVTNLTSNALKFTAGADFRRVTIRARRADRDVRVEVSDTGPGVPPELCERIFDPFVRGTSAASGHGLGLATVWKLAEAHGGQVDFAANAEGGCTFWFELPSWPAPAKSSLLTRVLAPAYGR